MPVHTTYYHEEPHNHEVEWLYLTFRLLYQMNAILRGETTFVTQHQSCSWVQYLNPTEAVFFHSIESINSKWLETRFSSNLLFYAIFSMCRHSWARMIQLFRLAAVYMLFARKWMIATSCKASKDLSQVHYFYLYLLLHVRYFSD